MVSTDRTHRVGHEHTTFTLANVTGVNYKIFNVKSPTEYMVSIERACRVADQELLGVYTSLTVLPQHMVKV